MPCPSWVACHERRLNTTVRNRTDPSRSAIRCSSHRKLLSSKAMVVSVAETPGRDSGRARLREASASEPSMKCRKRIRSGGDPSSGISLGDVLRPPERHPACRRREAQPGSCTYLIGDAKGKGASGSNREAGNYRCAGQGADCFVIAMKRV